MIRNRAFRARPADPRVSFGVRARSEQAGAHNRGQSGSRDRGHAMTAPVGRPTCPVRATAGHHDASAAGRRSRRSGAALGRGLPGSTCRSPETRNRPYQAKKHGSSAGQRRGSAGHRCDPDRGSRRGAAQCGDTAAEHVAHPPGERLHRDPVRRARRAFRPPRERDDARENRLAPQPTANIANAILTQAPELRSVLGHGGTAAPDAPSVTVVVVMTPTLIRKPSNHHLTVVGLGWRSWILMLTSPRWPP